MLLLHAYQSTRHQRFLKVLVLLNKRFANFEKTNEGWYVSFRGCRVIYTSSWHCNAMFHYDSQRKELDRFMEQAKEMKELKERWNLLDFKYQLLLDMVPSCNPTANFSRQSGEFPYIGVGVYKLLDLSSKN